MDSNPKFDEGHAFPVALLFCLVAIYAIIARVFCLLMR